MAAAKKQTKKDLENKIVELEAKLTKLASQLETPAPKPAEVKPAETKPAPKPAEVKPAETKPKPTLPKGSTEAPKPAEVKPATTKPKPTLPKGMEEKPAEAPKPAETEISSNHSASSIRESIL